MRVVVVVLQDPVHGGDVDRLEAGVDRVRYLAPGAPQGRLLASLAVRLRRAPVNREAAPRVAAAHVDALDGAGLGALEAGLALERAVLVVEQLQPAAVLHRDVGRHLRVADRDLRREELPEGQRHPLKDPHPGHEAHAPALTGSPGS